MTIEVLEDGGMERELERERLLEMKLELEGGRLLLLVL
jgi:hypothetical protein